MHESVDTLSALRRRIARIGESRSTSGDAVIGLGHAGLDAALGGGLALGRVHEVFALQAADAGSATGFALMLAEKTRGGRAMLWLRTQAAEQRAGRVYGPGLAELSLDSRQLVLGIMPDDVTLLKAGVDGVRSAGLGVALIECWGNPRALDLTASRRLTIAAEKNGVTALLLRIDAVPAPSAAETRWAVHAAASAALEADAPGHPAIDVELLRRRAGPSGKRWHLEWNRDERSFRDAALSGAVVPLFRDGPAAEGAAGIVRHTA